MHPNQQRVLDALAGGARLTHGGIIDATGLDYVQAYSAMKVLLNGRVKRIVKIGTWAELCAETGEPMGSVRKDAGVYALAGTPMLRPLRDGQLPPRIGGGAEAEEGQRSHRPAAVCDGFPLGAAMSPEAVEKINHAVNYAFAEVAVLKRGAVRGALIDALDRQLIALALRLNDGRRMHAAQQLGMSRNTLLKRIRALGLDA